jgi:hypothetical protein
MYMVTPLGSSRGINSMHHHHLKHMAANAGCCMHASKLNHSALRAKLTRVLCDGEVRCMSRLGVPFLVNSDNLICSVATCHWILLRMEAKVGFSHAVVPCCGGLHAVQETRSPQNWIEKLMPIAMAAASKLLILLFIRGCHDVLYATFCFVMNTLFHIYVWFFWQAKNPCGWGWIFDVYVALAGARIARFCDLLRSANSLSHELYAW